MKIEEGGKMTIYIKDEKEKIEDDLLELINLEPHQQKAAIQGISDYEKAKKMKKILLGIVAISGLYSLWLSKKDTSYWRWHGIANAILFID